MKAKTTLLLSYGGMLKDIEEETLFNIEDKIVTTKEGVIYDITRVQSPLFNQFNKKFFRKIGEMFFIPLVIAALLSLISLKLILFSHINAFLVILLLVPTGATLFYAWSNIKYLSLRKELDGRLIYLLMVPFGSLIIAVLTMQEGFILTALFLNALAMFFLEEYAIKDIKWMLKKGVLFWELKNQDTKGKVTTLLLITEDGIAEAGQGATNGK